jgi:hypothetical protein
VKTKSKILASAIAASVSTNAMASVILVTSHEISKYEQVSGKTDVQQRLLKMGILIPTDRNDIFVISDADLDKVSDESVVSLASDLVLWHSANKIHQEKKQPLQMFASGQDYGIQK